MHAIDLGFVSYSCNSIIIYLDDLIYILNYGT